MGGIFTIFIMPVRTMLGLITMTSISTIILTVIPAHDFPLDPFAPYADMLPGQSLEANSQQGFDYRHNIIPSLDKSCSLTSASTTFAQYQSANQAGYVDFFCADDSAWPLPHEQLQVDDLALPFNTVREVHNSAEDWWLAHPAHSRFVVNDIGIRGTERQVESIEPDLLLDYLAEVQPAWFVLMHPHPSGTARNPSAADLVSHWRLEQDLIQRQAFIPFASVVAFDDGYFVFRPSDKMRDDFVKMSSDSQRYLQIIAMNTDRFQFQMEWDFQAANFGLSNDSPDFVGYTEAVHDKVEIVFAETGTEVVTAIHDLLSGG